MAVKIGHASIDEHGNIGGGTAGDQNGKEVYVRDWWLHELGWRVLRCKDPAKRELMAQDMEYACANPNIGYDQWQNETLYQEASKVGFNCSKVTKPCETDCARLIRVCVLYAGIDVPVFYTGTEAKTLLATGQFEELTDKKYTTSSDYLLRGDILVTKTVGHTLMVLTNGSKAVAAPAVTPVTPSKPAGDPTIAAAMYFDKAVAGKYQITTDLYLRSSADPTKNNVVYIMKQGKTAQCYGYYNIYNGVKWLCVTYGQHKGYCSSKYLKKV